MPLTPELKRRLPMWATMARVAITPFLFLAMLLETPFWPWITAILFILASLTDWLDGYWARLWKVESTMGKFMDPIADKILVLSALILLVYVKRIDPVAPTLLLSRDIFIGGIRAVAATSGLVIAAGTTGKWKTALQMIVIPCLFLGDAFFGLPLEPIGRIGLWVSVVLSLISGAQYTSAFYRQGKLK